MMRILIGLSLLLGITYAESQKLRYVIDGDTVQFAKVRCRLAWVDTPESHNNKKAYRDLAGAKMNNVKIEELVEAGRYAKRYLKSIMRKGKIYTFDIVDKERFREKGKNRAICVIYDEKGASINDRIVRDGFAVPFWRYIPTYKKREQLRDEVESAAKKHKGLWRTHPNVISGMI